MTSNFNAAEHLIKLKSKDYLQVMWRLVWFREEHPNWTISTEMLSHDAENKLAVFRCSIKDESGREVSSGHGSETAKDFGDYLEKAETKAEGRALAALGFGTQFTGDELDEGSRIVDSPVDRKKKEIAQIPSAYTIAPEGTEKRELQDRILEAVNGEFEIVEFTAQKRYGTEFYALSVDQLKDVIERMEQKNGTVGRDQASAEPT